MRRDGYDRYCAGDGGALKGSVFKGRRFGVRVTAEMCFPSIQQIAESLRLLMARHGLREVLLATNEQDAAELDRLRSLVPFRRWSPPTTLPPELIPLVELLLCREAEAFIGTFPSTFSTTILAQRDVRGANLDFVLLRRSRLLSEPFSAEVFVNLGQSKKYSQCIQE